MANDFVDWLNEELNKRGWTNSELKKRSGMANSTISMVISRQSKVGWDFCAGVAKAFGEKPEKVFRLAGLLPPQPEAGLNEETILYYYRQLPKAEQQAIINLMGKGRAVIQEPPEPYLTNLPQVPVIPDDEHIMELFKRLDQVRQRQVYDFARWMLIEQEYPLNSSSKLPKIKQIEWQEQMDLLLAVEAADPDVIGQVINRLQEILYQQQEKAR